MCARERESVISHALLSLILACKYAQTGLWPLCTKSFSLVEIGYSEAQPGPCFCVWPRIEGVISSGTQPRGTSLSSLSLSLILFPFLGQTERHKASFSLYFIRVYNTALSFFKNYYLFSLSLSFYFISRSRARYKLYLKRRVESCACLGTRVTLRDTALVSVEIIWRRRGKVVLWVNRLNYLRGFRGFVVEEWFVGGFPFHFEFFRFMRAPTYFFNRCWSNLNVSKGHICRLTFILGVAFDRSARPSVRQVNKAGWIVAAIRLT